MKSAPAGIKRDPAAATLWAFLHAGCCAAGVFSSLGSPPQSSAKDEPAEATGA